MIMKQLLDIMSPYYILELGSYCLIRYLRCSLVVGSSLGRGANRYCAASWFIAQYERR